MERYQSPKILRSKAMMNKALEKTTNSFVLKFILLLMCSIFMLAFTAVNAQTNQDKHFNNLNSDGVILDGYDAVAFLLVLASCYQP